MEQYDEDTLSTKQATHATRLLVIQHAAHYGYHLKQLDIAGAFLGRDMDKVVYIETPEGLSIGPEYECLVMLKAVYGLKQSPALWEEFITNELLNFGFVQAERAACLFAYRVNNKVMILALFVDDMLISCSDESIFETLVESLNECAQVGKYGNAELFVGLEIR